MSEKDTCEICDDNIAFYKNICIDCYKDGFNAVMKVNGISVYDVLIKVRKRLKKINNYDYDYENIRVLTEFQQFLLKLIKIEFTFNPKVDVKSPSGIIFKKKICVPHTICDINNLLFCSNCGDISHTNYLVNLGNDNLQPLYKVDRSLITKDNVICQVFDKNNIKVHFTCEEFAEIKKNLDSDFIQNWIMTVINNPNEVDRIQKRKKEQMESIKIIESYDMRKCPYTEYHSAKAWEVFCAQNGSLNKEDMLTKKYSEEEWPNVACDGKPVFRDDCKDMYCGVHNPERIRQMTENGIKIGKKIHGCGRKINWDFWVIVKPTPDEFDYSKIEKSKLVELTIRDNLVPEYTCSECNTNRTCMGIIIRSESLWKNKPICGHCILNKGVSHNEFEKLAHISYTKNGISKTITLKIGKYGHATGVFFDGKPISTEYYYDTYNECNVYKLKTSDTTLGYFNFRLRFEEDNCFRQSYFAFQRERKQVRFERKYSINKYLSNNPCFEMIGFEKLKTIAKQNLDN